MAIIDWSRQDAAARGESASVDEQLIHSQRRDRAIEETVDATLREWQRGGSFMGGLALAGSLGMFSGALSLGGGYSTSSGTRNVSADTVQHLADAVAQSSSATRRMNSTSSAGILSITIDRITVRGARQHNLKNINVEIPRNRFTVITGLSGSRKSSLEFAQIITGI